MNAMFLFYLLLSCKTLFVAWTIMVPHGVHNCQIVFKKCYLEKKFLILIVKNAAISHVIQAHLSQLTMDVFKIIFFWIFQKGLQ